MNFSQIESEALALSADERASLAQRLLLSLDEMPDSQYERLWAEESVRRVAQVESGSMPVTASNEVARKARALLE